MADEGLPDSVHPAHLGWGFAAAAAVVVIWSGFNIVSRLGGRSPLTPYDMAAIRFGVSGLVWLPFVLARGRRLAWLRLGVLAGIGGMAYALLIYSGFALAPAAHAGILVNGGIPFASALIAWLVLGQRPGRRAELALLVAGSGIVLIGMHSFAHAAGNPPQQWLGDVYFLLAAIGYACFGLLLKHWHVPPIEATVGVAVVSMVCYTPIYVLFLPKAIASAPISLVLLQCAYQGILVASIAGLLFAYAIHNIGPQRTTLMLAMVPGISAVAAVPLLGESLDVLTVAGVVLVAVGAVLGASHRSARRRANGCTKSDPSPPASDRQID